jgi:pimeloyl-ACP methyl ester carboxylesterase
MPYLDLNGKQIYYALHRARSEGTPVLLIHGAGENHLIWPIGLRRLPGTIVYAIDLPGHGKSTGRGCSTIEEYAHWIVSFMGAARLDRVILIGHSMGGAIAQVCGLKYPDRVRGLILIATSAKLRVAPQLLQLAGSDFSASVDLVSQWGWGPLVPDEIRQLGKQQLLQIRPETLLDDYRACDAFDVRDHLPEISAPALIIAGEADQMTPLKHAMFLAEQLPHARLVAVPQAGHMVMLEAAEIVTRAVTEFVSEVAKRSV